MAQRKLIFLHIPKTAGTSLREVFTNNYPPAKVALCYGRDEIEGKLKQALADEKEMIFGHIDFKQLERAGDFSEYHLLTFLRHPVARTISHYLHFLNNQGHGHRELKEGGFEAFLDSPYAQNWQCQVLAGLKREEEALTQPGLLYEKALANFEKLHWVGITERYAESLISLKHFLKLAKLPQKEKNTTPSVPLKKELLKKFEKEILERNAEDLKLYQHAQARLDQQLEKVPALALRKLALRLKKS